MKLRFLLRMQQLMGYLRRARHARTRPLFRFDEIESRLEAAFSLVHPVLGQVPVEVLSQSRLANHRMHKRHSRAKTINNRPIDAIYRGSTR